MLLHNKYQIWITLDETGKVTKIWDRNSK